MGTAFAGEGVEVEGAWRLIAPVSIFLSALLLFAIEPLIAKMILPWFGGSAAVWMTCLLFFQTALLAGYLYAHLLATAVPRRWQWRIHVSLLIVSLAFLPAVPAAHWKPTDNDNPLLLILGLLAATIGLPFALLSSTTPLITAWAARRSTSSGMTSLTRLYALSNLGSMLALLSYPVLIEPNLATHIQALSWSGLYAAFVCLGVAASWRLGRSGAVAPITAAADDRSPTATDTLLWLLLPMAASALLLAVTNHILRNIAAMPLLWVGPLAIYLFSLVIVFESPRWYYRPFWYGWFAILTGLMIYVILGLFLVGRFLPQLLFYLAGFFVCCMVCHGELAALKPPPRHLSAYYLTIAAGGALGGLLVAALAPLLLSADFDLAILLPATVLLVLWVIFRRWPLDRTWRIALLVLLLVALGSDTGLMVKRARDDFATAVFAERNFYGTLRVSDVGDERMLQNGNVVHGRQLLAQDLARRPVSYYGPHSGIGLAVQLLQARGPLHIGVIGLGTGTMAAHGRSGDRVTFYEINPAVPAIAHDYFSFISTSGAATDIHMGDARLSLEREAPQGFDLLAIDAFTSDSIPVHLLTREAFAQYWRHLKPDGIIAVHVSNLYIDLAPVVMAAAEADGKTAVLVSDDGDGKAEDRSDWMLIAADPALAQHPPLSTAYLVSIQPAASPWTDDYSNLWRSLRR